MTFENNQIDYKLEIKTLREYMQKADSLEKYDNLIESGTLWEINRRKEAALEDGLIPLRYKGVRND